MTISQLEESKGPISTASHVHEEFTNKSNLEETKETVSEKSNEQHIEPDL